LNGLVLYHSRIMHIAFQEQNSLVMYQEQRVSSYKTICS
jgi:hypothetical protein